MQQLKLTGKLTKLKVGQVFSGDPKLGNDVGSFVSALYDFLTDHC